MGKYQNSYCKRNLLHDFKILTQTSDGLLERCARCGLKKHFPNNTPSHVYLSFHIRQSLQVYDPRYHIEYGPR